jgi:chlorophyll synthase
VKWLDPVFALRPLLWIPAVALYAAGAAWAAPGTRTVDVRDPALGALLLLLGAVHLANGWRDREGDRGNQKGHPIATGAVGGRALFLMGSVAVAGAAALALGLAPRVQALLLAAGALGVAYTAPPIELKRRAGWDLGAHAVGYGVVAFMLGTERAQGGATSGAVGGALGASIPYALGIGSVAARTMLADLEGDRTAGQRTLAVALGTNKAERLAEALAWSTMAAGLTLGDWIPLLWGFLAGVQLSLSIGTGGSRGNALTPVGLQVLFLALLGARTVEPLVFALAVGLVSAIYYGRRWGLSYPIRMRWWGRGLGRTEAASGAGASR